MARAPLLAVVALLAGVVLQSAGAAAKGEERVLVVLATSGPKPYTVGEVERTAQEVDAFYQTSSLGRLRLHVDVTPWLAAFQVSPGCGGLTNDSFEAVLAPARVAADQAGFNAAQYDDAMYAIADAHCAFHGETWGHEVMLTTQPTLQLLTHELGHTFGLGHAQSTDCGALHPVRCAHEGTGDPFSPMGHGTLDFSAYEKVLLGWLPRQPHVTSAGTYALAVPTIKTATRQALVVDDTEGSWWIEYRARPFRGLVIRFVEADDVRSPFAPPSVVILDPGKTGRPWLARGQSYRIPGSFRVTLIRAGASTADVRLR